MRLRTICGLNAGHVRLSLPRGILGARLAVPTVDQPSSLVLSVIVCSTSCGSLVERCSFYLGGEVAAGSAPATPVEASDELDPPGLNADPHLPFSSPDLFRRMDGRANDRGPIAPWW